MLMARAPHGWTAPDETASCGWALHRAPCDLGGDDRSDPGARHLAIRHIPPPRPHVQHRRLSAPGARHPQIGFGLRGGPGGAHQARRQRYLGMQRTPGHLDWIDQLDRPASDLLHRRSAMLVLTRATAKARVGSLPGGTYG